jgi:hypothetical protein
MDKVHQLRWSDFVATMTCGEVFREWQESLAHCERYKAAHPERALPAEVMIVLSHMVSAYQHLRPLLEDRGCWDQPAQPAMTNFILSLARKVRRELPLCSQMGHA